MKRKIFAACALTTALLALAGCSQSATSETQSTAASDSTSAVAEDSAASAEKTVSPLPTGIDMDHLDDCTVAVSFEKGDAYVDDTGAMQLKVKVYAYDQYDMVDISTLQVGDRITICQQDVEVTSLERDEDGRVILNGGMENGGYELVTNGNTVYYLDQFDMLKEYYELGEATIPVSADDFEFVDSSDLDKDPITYYAGDFLTDDSGIEYHFVPNNTTITIQGGYVIHMDRVYNP